MKLIPKRMELLNKIDYNVVKLIENMVAKEDKVRWANSPDGELREDTTEYVSVPFGRAVWGLIHGMTP